jgi:phosphoenolpyruvate---glycerone phosphotransferase subunit DhaL
MFEPYQPSNLRTFKPPMTITKGRILLWLNAYASAIYAKVDELNELDGAGGDGDFGATMARGLKAMQAKLPSLQDKENIDIGTILKTMGMTLVSAMGGTSGPLMGTLFMQMGGVANGKHELTLQDWTAMLEAGLNGMMARGKAQLGDKTMLDAFIPALEALKANTDADLKTALQASAQAAAEGRDHTATLIAKKGRASYVGERALGHIDPGAVSAHLFVQALADSVNS